MPLPRQDTSQSTTSTNSVKQGVNRTSTTATTTTDILPGRTPQIVSDRYLDPEKLKKVKAEGAGIKLLNPFGSLALLRSPNIFILVSHLYDSSH